MRWSVILLASLLVLCTSLPAEELSREEYCSKVWRYDHECALDYLLSDTEVQKVASVAEKLKGEDCKDTAWKILEWEYEHLSYDFEKANLPPPQIVVKGEDVEVYDSGRYIQTPYETILRGKGICTDYAFLTLALLKYNGCEGYLVNVIFENDEMGHVAAAILVNGTYFILDQHLPPFDPEGYFIKWLNDGKRIKKAEIIIGGNTTLLDLTTGYSASEKDAESLESKLYSYFESMGMRRDSRLNGKVLPPGYREGYILKLSLEMSEYYHPEFEKQYAEHIFKVLKGKIEDRYRAFNLDVSINRGNFEMVLYLAR
ncbi:transglutaminase-like domain-containing protein [Archaeoglobus sp.]